MFEYWKIFCVAPGDDIWINHRTWLLLKIWRGRFESQCGRCSFQCYVVFSVSRVHIHSLRPRILLAETIPLSLLFQEPYLLELFLQQSYPSTTSSIWPYPSSSSSRNHTSRSILPGTILPILFFQKSDFSAFTSRSHTPPSLFLSIEV